MSTCQPGEIRRSSGYFWTTARVVNFWNNNYIECESSGERNKNLSVKEYLNEIQPYLRDIIIDLQNSDTWKIQLTIVINFIFSNDLEKELIMHLKSDNVEFVSYDNANKVVDELFSHFFQGTKLVQKHQWEGAILFSTQFNCWITNVTR